MNRLHEVIQNVLAERSLVLAVWHARCNMHVLRLKALVTSVVDPPQGQPNRLRTVGILRGRRMMNR
jgi:hypothetical protein